MEKVRIQDDLFRFVNGEWIEKAEIPADKVRVGGFSDLDTGVEEILMKDFKDMAKGKKEIPNSYMENAVMLYKKALNVKKRNKDGIKPVVKDLEKIKSLSSISDFNKKLKEFILRGFHLPFQLGVDTDMKNSKVHSVIMAGPSTILPDTKYYLEEQKETKAQLVQVWTMMVKELLKFTDLGEEADDYIKGALEFDEKVASLVKSQEEWSRYTECYNPMKVNKVQKLLKGVALKRVMKKLLEKEVEQIIVYDPRFLNGFTTLFNEETFTSYKKWAYIMKLISSANSLSEEIRTIGNTYRRVLTGLQKDTSIEKQAYNLAGRYFSDPVGLYYGETYFGSEAKKDVIDIVKEIINTYKTRIEKNDFLGEETKAKAILKLSKMELKMGYPDSVKEIYSKLVVKKSDSLYKALEELQVILTNEQLSKLFKEVDRTEWAMPGHMVNACYNPSANDITFPAAILQAPFYSIKQTRSQNLGGIGAVIGHEISHAFDNNGANCDENGNLNNWWTKKDKKAFEKRTQKMVEQFDGIEFMGTKINGKFVVSENIADNGGMAVTLDIMGRMKEKSYEEYFISWAKVWCMKATEEYMKLLVSIDVHSPNELRTNIPVRNFDEWYDTFNVKKTDKMYIEKKKRVHIW